MGLLFVKVFVMRDAYAPLRRAEDWRCVTKGSTMWAASTCEAGYLQGIRKPYFLVQAEELSWQTYWLGGRWHAVGGKAAWDSGRCG